MTDSFQLTPLHATDHLARTPFGLEDPRLASSTRLLEEFVDFSDDSRFGGLAVTNPDENTLLFVGPPGSGRTTYMRRAAFLLEGSNPAVVSTGLYDENVPSIDLLHEVCGWYQPADVVSRLQGLWRAAALRVLSSHILTDARLEYPLGEDAADFEGKFADILELEDADSQRVESIYSQLTAIVNQNCSPNDLTSVLESGQWAELEADLAMALTFAKPFILYVDAFDQEARHGPAHWLSWEKALFYQVLHFAGATEFDQHFRMVATVTDVTYAAVREGVRATKYPAGNSIRLLQWNRESTAEFLRAKIRKLADKYWLMLPDQSPLTIESWLGASMIENARMNSKESLEDYLVSHTRYSPRDIVNLGNALCEEVRSARSFGFNQVPDHDLRARVEGLALDVGREQLGLAAADLAGKELASRLDDLSEFHHDETFGDERTVELPSGIRQLADAIEAVIREVGVRYFNRAMFDNAVVVRDADRLFDDVDLLSVLWRNRLVAQWQWTDEGYRPVFFTSGRRDHLQLPYDQKYFVFHRVLLDVTGIDPVGSNEAINRTLYVVGASGSLEAITKFLTAMSEAGTVAAKFFAWVEESEAGSPTEPLEPLRVAQVRLTSPGFWVFGGNGKILEFIRGILADRHTRRQDRDYREAAEKDKLGLENERIRLENGALVRELVDGDIKRIRDAGISEEEIAKQLESLLDSSVVLVASAARVIEPETARLLEPGEPPSDFTGEP